MNSGRGVNRWMDGRMVWGWRGGATWGRMVDRLSDGDENGSTHIIALLAIVSSEGVHGGRHVVVLRKRLRYSSANAFRSLSSESASCCHAFGPYLFSRPFSLIEMKLATILSTTLQSLYYTGVVPQASRSTSLCCVGSHSILLASGSAAF